LRRFAAAAALHGGLYAAAFLALLALLRRPVLAAGAVLALHGLVLIVSSAKQRVLREPLVFADLGLFTQALRHPRLYLPYLGLGRAALASAALAGVLAAALWLEDAAAVPQVAWWALTGAGLALLASGTWLGRGSVSLDPVTDVRRLGLLSTLWLYWLAERGSPQKTWSDPGSPGWPAIVAPRGVGPDLVVVQSESFFDPRRLYPGVAADVLAPYDALCAQGESGRLAVPVWGAYTMRTEFAFLSGIAPARLGVHRFNPYRRFARAGVATLASHLREHGYRTLCIHPYPGSFFGRDRIFPRLGFERFLDIEAFAAAPRSGPYVADGAVTAKILEALRESGGPPSLVFVITMENHGPLHLERAGEQDARRLYREPPPRGLEDLTVYLRHLQNAGRMLTGLAAELARREGVLCFYGDHVPGMPRVYAALGYEDSRTDYLLWRSGGGAPRRADLAVEALGLRLLEVAGLATPRA